jgi:D-glycero-beta-D-manno-heptose 1-phosphate adenylyltransferase
MDKLEVITQKIIPFDKIDPIIAYWKFLNKKIVFTNGCFDILHRGHIVYLAKAASYGDLLVIGLNSDLSVKNIKGPSRPIQDQQSRALILAALHFVSHIILFDEDTPYNLIKKVQPDVLVKGADYKPEDIVGYDIVTAKGGEIVTIDFVEGYSTTGIIKKMNC